jgi:hypothetical protein
MNINKIRVGDVVVFRTLYNPNSGKTITILHGMVNSKGKKFASNMYFNDSNVLCDGLFISVLEYPEWKDVFIKAEDVVKVIIVPEVVHFT